VKIITYLRWICKSRVRMISNIGESCSPNDVNTSIYACSHKAIKCSQAKCSADLATWVCPVVECQTQLGVPIDLCCFSFYEFAFPLHHNVKPALQTKQQPAYQWWNFPEPETNREIEFVSSKMKIPVLVVLLELRSQMEDPKCLSNRKYPTKDIMAPPCTAKSCTLSTKP